ncbi:MAG: A24 family peptidase [Oscillospiraceae bacterium]
MILSAVIGAAVSAAFAYLCFAAPCKWLCDYGENPSEKHSKAARKPTAARYAFFAAAGAICTCLYARNATVLACLCFSAFCGAMLWLGWCDAKYGILPDEIIIIAVVLALPFAISEGVVASLMGAALAFGVSYGILWLAGKIYHTDAVGMGDVKLAAAAGFACGIGGVAAAAMIAIFSAAIVFSVLMLAKKLNKRDNVPFGPYLVFGILAALCFKPELTSLVNLYLSAFKL